MGGEENNPILCVRILEKQNLQAFEIQSPADQGPWNQVKLTRGIWTVNGIPLTRMSYGSPQSKVKLKAANLTRIYPGQIVLSSQGGPQDAEMVILNLVSLSDYTACVTAYESDYDDSQPEYLKALAVVVRTFARAHRGRHRTYDLCDLSHCQVYQGLPPRFGFWEKIAEAGAGFYFPSSFDARSIYFHRCCGGLLESADQIWGGTPSPNRTGSDEWNGEILCRADPFSHWTSTTAVQNAEGILRAMAQLPPDAVLKTLEIEEKTKFGRNKTLLATFQLAAGETLAIHENAVRFESEFGKKFGWRVFPSDLFEIHQKDDTYQFTGRGLGHGVGLCQSGALRLAQLGWSYEKILNFYFPQNSGTN